MNLLEAIRTSMTEILGHKLRSMLTLVGIVLGTTSLVVMVSVIGGLAEVLKGLSDLGFDGVMFVTAQPRTEHLEKKKQGRSRGLRTSDLRPSRRARSSSIRSAHRVLASEDEPVRINGRDLKVNVDGITPAYGVIRNRGAAAGRFIVAARRRRRRPRWR